VSGPLQSTFFADGGAGAFEMMIVKTTTIKFTTITCAIDSTTGAPQVNKDGEIRAGKIDTLPLKLCAGEQGKSKDVYNVWVIVEREILD
jgi:hypothetical protein